MRPTFKPIATALCAALFAAALNAAAIAQANNCPFAVSGGLTPTLARDGLLLVRYALGVRDTALVEKTGTTKTSSVAESSIIDAALRLDLDGDGSFTPTDALLAARYLAGFSGAALTESVNLVGATRGDEVLITQYIDGGCVIPTPTDAQLKTIAEASLAANLRKSHPHTDESGNPNAGASTPSVSPGNAFTQGIPGDDIEQTALYSVPSITGEEGGFDIFNAVNPGDAKPGLRLTTAFYSGVYGRSRDAPGDRYLLGDAAKAFYLGRTGAIDNDFARIMEMDVSRGGNEIVLHGSPSQYRFIETAGQEPGTAIFFNNGGVFDLIGFIDVHVITNATDPAYKYVTTPPSITPVPSLALDQFGGANADTITGLSVDTSGNIYVLGFSQSDLTAVFPVTTGTGQLFVAKYSAAGGRVWLTRFGSVGQIGDLAWDMAIDDTAAYVAARYIAPASSIGGLKDAAHFKLDLATGTVLNEALWQGRGVQFPGAVALDNSEYVYFSGIGLDVAQPNPDGSQDPYIEKRRRSDLSLVKRKMFGGDAGSVPGAGGAANKEPWGGLTFIPSTSGVAVEGTLFSAGWTMKSYEGTTEVGGGDVFLVAFDQDLNELWAEGWGSSFRDWAWSMDRDRFGNIYVAGLTLGSMAGTGSNLGFADGFITKFNPNAPAGSRRLWTKQLGTTQSDEIRKIRIIGDAIYATGHTYGNAAGTNAGRSDVWLVRLDLDGNVQQTTQVGSAEDDRGIALAVTANNVYVGGATFGSLVKATQGFIDAIVLKFARN
jgi:hypothetical protein